MKVKNGFNIISLIVSLVVLVAVIICTYASLSALNELKRSQETGFETKEDGVIISDKYIVKSTVNISDAYRNGDTSGLSDKDRETLDMASAVIDEIITDGMSDFEKEKAVFDWLIENLGQDKGLLTVVPTSGADSDNPYGSLKYHQAVCVGYSTTFRLLMQMLDIPCMVIHERGLYHTWNMVQLDGDWYHVDPYLGRSSDGYAYFNITDDMCTLNWDREFFPSANSLEYNMAAIEALPCDDVYTIPSYVKEAVEVRGGMVSLLFSSDITNKDAKIAERLVKESQSAISKSPGNARTKLSSAMHRIPAGYLFVVNIEYDTSGGEELSGSEEQAIRDAVNSTFGGVQGEESGETAGSHEATED